MRKLEKTELKGFSRDTTSRAVLNTDNTQLEAYKAQKKRMAMIHSTEARLAAVEEKLDLLEKLVNDHNTTN